MNVPDKCVPVDAWTRAQGQWAHKRASEVSRSLFKCQVQSIKRQGAWSSISNHLGYERLNSTCCDTKQDRTFYR